MNDEFYNDDTDVLEHEFHPVDEDEVLDDDETAHKKKSEDEDLDELLENLVDPSKGDEESETEDY